MTCETLEAFEAKGIRRYPEPPTFPVAFMRGSSCIHPGLATNSTAGAWLTTIHAPTPLDGLGTGLRHRSRPGRSLGGRRKPTVQLMRSLKNTGVRGARSPEPRPTGPCRQVLEVCRPQVFVAC
jgi:hypothetical protein